MIARVGGVSEEMSFEPICLEGFSCKQKLVRLKKNNNNNLLASISYSKL